MQDVIVERIVNIRHARLLTWRRTKHHPRVWDGAVLMTEGKIEYHFDEKTVIAEAGDLLFLPGNLPYSGRPLQEPVGFFVLDFFCDEPDGFSRFGAPKALPAEDYSGLCRRFSEVTERWETQTADASLCAKSFLYQLLELSLQEGAQTKTVTSTGQIVEYILENLSDPTLSVGKLCEQFFISESQLRRNLRKATGLKPNEYVLCLRMRRAEGLLTDTELPVKAVAEACGFASPYYFTQCFTRHTGLSPRDYRHRSPL